MRVWHRPSASSFRPFVEVARSDIYRTTLFRVDRRDGMVFVLREDSSTFAGMINLIEVKIGPNAKGELFLVDIKPYRAPHEVWLGQISWLLEALEVTVDVDEFSDDDEAWNLVHRLEYLTKPTPMTFTVPEEELSVYSLLGEKLPFLWPFERLLSWALERPDAVVMGDL